MKRQKWRGQHWRTFTWIEEKLPAQPLFTMLAAFRVVIVVVSGFKSLDNVNGKGQIRKKKMYFFGMKGHSSASKWNNCNYSSRGKTK